MDTYSYQGARQTCTCPGPQQYEGPHIPQCKNGGLCVAWYVRYAELRLRNPMGLAQTLIGEMLHLSAFDMFMQRYISHINSTLYFSGLQFYQEEFAPSRGSDVH